MGKVFVEFSILVVIEFGTRSHPKCSCLVDDAFLAIAFIDRLQCNREGDVV